MAKGGASGIHADPSVRVKTVAAQLTSAAMLIGVFVVYGYLQERIMTMPFGESGELFRASTVLVLFNRIGATLIAFFFLWKNKEPMYNVPPLSHYFMISVSNNSSSICAYEALKWITYPTQTIFKCGKMIPVMVFGTLMSGKKYVLKDYVVALAVTAGCASFALTGRITKHGAEEDSVIGVMIMLAYLTFDAFTPTFQARLFKQYKTTRYNQMAYINICSIPFALVLSITGGQFFPALSFLAQHPEAWFFVIALAVVATAGQLIIYLVIEQQGALFFSTVNVIRNMVNIVLSSMLFDNDVTVAQYLSTLSVFGVLIYSKFSAPSAPKK
mmetsp:Transcript_3677/g.8904  ORF Transcript_3677/g.8904 Transcript_3677/m.8904 type:complete len:328 (-) Transcript_3677:64-1047(-)|eukprot:CAMPEP_0177639592 /NCGR_PEP_ID=MMETSP0447-20121125/6102_1 /TAXON_ID=0 /ORGANISM="Stygamoeba regulata, Strain BSH-02190019" /LENGTH=327 /DNA_ID=CAMNT_0019141627 /DNA_START=42 /DNA_END=1025 /DNA_ORIENTATION=+